MTIGISKERLEELLHEGLPGVIDFKSQCLGVIAILLRDECTDLNPWLPIESAPKGRPVLLYGGHVPCCQMFVGHADANWSWQPTHWMELPEPPK